MEYKAAPTFLMGIDNRTVTGIFAVHGNIDEGGDRSYPGLFGDFTAKGRPRARFLWQHDGTQPPIASIDRMFEVARADLPPAVLKYAPNASGGVAVQRTYLEDDFAERVFGAVKSGALTEMSYAYDPTDWKMTDEARELYRADIFDVSDVNWGMNPATSADGQKGLPLDLEHQAVRAAVERYSKRLHDLAALRAKEGRVLSGENRKRIESAIDALAGAQTALKDLLSASEPAKSGLAETHQLRALWTQQQQRLRDLGVFS
jgi:hypothetical protein